MGTKAQERPHRIRPLSQRVAVASLFGAAVFISKVFIPTHMDKVLIFVQAMFLALGSLLIRPLGATVVAAIGGVLTAFWRASLAPITVAFSLIYGMLVDGLIMSLGVVDPRHGVRMRRLVASVTLSTTIVGLASYYVTTHVLELLPRNLLLEVALFIAGIVSGLVGGYLASLLWERAVRHLWIREARH